MNTFKEYLEINNDFVEYAVTTIESAFNQEYHVYHENIILLVDNQHNIEIEELQTYSNIKNYDIFNTQDLNYSINKLLCLKENTLLIHFIPGHFSEIKPSVFIPDLVSFTSNINKLQSVRGEFYPEFETIADKVEFKPPNTFFICSFDLDSSSE
ncbi:MAG: hypothetical protein H6572_01400 [Lewinellaceae bacterium]|nr:hypothetical protein [Lewinellaceae bacterium]